MHASHSALEHSMHPQAGKARTQVRNLLQFSGFPPENLEVVVARLEHHGARLGFRVGSGFDSVFLFSPSLSVLDDASPDVWNVQNSTGARLKSTIFR